MFAFRRLLTALVFTGLCSGAAFANQAPSQSGLQQQLDTHVATAVFETLHEVNTDAHNDVLVASYRFEPEATESELVAKVKIQFFDADGNRIRTIVRDGE